MSAETKLFVNTERFVWQSWAGDAVIFDRLSGDSWMIENPGGRILEAVSEKEALLHQTPRDFSLDDPALSAAHGAESDEVVATLIQLGVLTRIENTRPVD